MRHIQLLSVAILYAACASTVAHAADACGSTFVDALEACEPSVCQFEHPIMAGQIMENRVLGLENGACHYIQKMPNGGQMECYWSEDDRKAVANYMRKMAQADTVGASANTDLETGQTTSSHRLDGEPVVNPIAQAMANGQCKISGYGQ